MRPLARLVDELRINAYGSLAIGDGALVAAAFLVDRPGQSILWFALVTVGLAVIWALFGTTGKLRTLARAAPQAPAESTIEAVGTTRRRLIVGLAPIGLVLAVLVGIAPESAAVIAGVPAGIGAADLWMSSWIRSLERRRGDLLLRETPASAFSGGARPVYTRPMKDATDAT